VRHTARISGSRIPPVCWALPKSEESSRMTAIQTTGGSQYRARMVAHHTGAAPAAKFTGPSATA
jgi:hypothetical protein